jgi:hypothetical protein
MGSCRGNDARRGAAITAPHPMLCYDMDDILTDAVIDRARGAFVGLAVGDALAPRSNSALATAGPAITR